MPIKTYVRHLIAVQVPIELPDICPHCGELLNYGGEITKLCLGIDGIAFAVDSGELSEEGHGVNIDEPGAVNDKDVVAFACTKCRELLAGTHRRTWILEAMSHELASQFKTLLYDDNVLDEFIKKKVFG